MKRRRTTSVCWLVVTAGLACGLAAQAFGETAAYELCIEQSPTEAGTVVPGSGTHRFRADTVVALSAEPQPGYQFVYWLGDVSDPKSQWTTVRVNSPKVVVAVFQPADKDRLKEEFIGGGGGGGGGGLAPTALDLGSPTFHSPAGGSSTSRAAVVPVIATPEPATIILLGLGALALRKRLR